MGRVRVPALSFPVPPDLLLRVPHPSRFWFMGRVRVPALSFPVPPDLLLRVPHPSRFWFMGRVRVPALRRLFRLVYSCGCRILPASGSWEGCGFRPSAAFSAWFTLAGAASFPILPHGKGAGSGPPPPFPPGLFLRVPHPSRSCRMARVRVPALRRLFRLVYSCGCRILPDLAAWEGCGFRPSL
jgi:hypothetical protein